MHHFRPDRLAAFSCGAQRAVRNASLLVLGLLLAAGPASVAMCGPASAKSNKHHHARKAHKPRNVKVVAKPTETASPSEEDDKPTPVKILSRKDILAADPERLERLGRHLIVGYHSLSTVKALVESKAIAGVFITDHNVRRRSVAAIKADIESLQSLRAAQGLPPLIVAADQEGGSVSRLSPPLKRQPSLGRILRGLEHDVDRKAAVETYAKAQAEQLRRIGVTLNFAPVVDLKLKVRNRRDGETRLRVRAIDSDPFTVAKVAGWYCDTMAKAGIMCTLKHFPGLGRVARDTHVVSGEITASEGKLELNDWVPFRRVMKRPGATVMIGHVRVGAIDKSIPASYSRTVIHDLVRKTWRYDGLLITDDFSMGAITRSKPGVGGAAVMALDAGVDLVLVSYLEKHFDKVMSTLLAADAEGRFDKAKGERSRNRIARVLRAAQDLAE